MLLLVFSLCFFNSQFTETNAATGDEIQNEFVNTIEEQIQLLRKKRCKCKVN